jgi:probable addiction module antidote protein
MPIETYPYDSAEFLDRDEAMAEYMDEAFKTGDAAFIARSLGTVARARGMSQIAREAGVSRESLYRALSEKGNPEFATVLRVINALGLRLTTVAAPGAADTPAAA